MDSFQLPSFFDAVLADALDPESSLLVMAKGLGLQVVLQQLLQKTVILLGGLWR